MSCKYSLSHRDTTLTPQRWFANSPLLVVHTEGRPAEVKMNRCVIHTESRLLKRHTRHDDDVCVCFQGVSPCQSKPLDKLDAVEILTHQTSLILTKLRFLL